MYNGISQGMWWTAVALLLGVATLAAQQKYIGKPGPVQIYAASVPCTAAERTASTKRPHVKSNEPNVIEYVSDCEIRALQPGPLMATVSPEGRVRIEPGFTAEEVLAYVVKIWKQGLGALAK